MSLEQLRAHEKKVDASKLKKPDLDALALEAAEEITNLKTNCFLGKEKWRSEKAAAVLRPYLERANHG